MRALALPSPAGAEASGQHSTLLPLLCKLLCAVIPPTRYALSPLLARPQGAMALGGSAAKPLQALGGGEEVTLDALEGGEGTGAASIVEVYAAILLGFLVEGEPGARAAAAAALPTGTLAPVVAAVARCLAFYLTAGAITKGSETSLRRLLASLQKGEGADGTGNGGDGGGSPLRR